MTGALRPGAFVRLDETAAALGVSITPVREALLKLSGEGMVQLQPHRGYLVAPLSRKDIEDIFWLQATIARELVRTTAENITDPEIDELAALNDALADAVAERDANAIVRAEFELHRALNRPAGRVKLSWFLLHASRYMPPLVYAGDPGWGADAVDNHARLIAALRARDVDTVVSLTDWQFVDGARRLTRILEQTGMWDAD